MLTGGLLKILLLVRRGEFIDIPPIGLFIEDSDRVDFGFLFTRR